MDWNGMDYEEDCAEEHGWVTPSMWSRKLEFNGSCDIQLRSNGALQYTCCVSHIRSVLAWAMWDYIISTHEALISLSEAPRRRGPHGDVAKRWICNNCAHCCCPDFEAHTWDWLSRWTCAWHDSSLAWTSLPSYSVLLGETCVWTLHLFTFSETKR